MNPEILDFMNQRRKCKRGTKQYKQLDIVIRNKCSKAKTNFYNAQCAQLEKLERSNPQLMHDKVNKIIARNNIAVLLVASKQKTVGYHNIACSCDSPNRPTYTACF